ncbi:uncharacterized protein LOC106643378 [Copidosoma floridanum]|uniref:uncharacterized protein LOC106643378 n=1 Tax=Copidosoma floridanum TaxID=29053 RepID=UPI0006C9B46A|nr:uncharacterized protein LOC106643378 [Copidosoma floridanum]XP_014213967.1 uncharacterized protein LOC106643378 [Copidosoma floridanum]
MAVDNPSYFSLRGGDSKTSASPPATSSSQRSFGGFFRRNKHPKMPPVVTTDRNGMPVLTTGAQQLAKGNSSGASTGQRRSFRSLFRSVSASADCEKTRQFLKGEPLPTDIAPPSPCFRSRRRYGPKQNGEPQICRDVASFYGLSSENGSSTASGLSRCIEDEDYYQFGTGSECASEASTLPLDEVRIMGQRNYYNLTSTLPSTKSQSHVNANRQRLQHQQHQQQQTSHQRRHSIGTFMERERSAIAASTAMASRTQPHRSMDLVDENDDATECDVARPSASRHNRLGTRHATTTFIAKPPETSSTAIRDDVVFISSRDNGASTLWVNYLTACFEQISRQQGKPPFRVLQLTFEEQLGPGADVRVRNSRLQIVVVCPIFLERVVERPEHATSVTRLLNTDRVLAMMLGVQDSHLSASQKASLVTYPSWRKFFVKDQDETFVGHLLGAAVTILGNASANNLKIDKTGFSVHPKKVKTGHNRILALLNDPLQPEDTVTVIVDRCGDALEISHVKRRNPYTLQFAVPESCLDVSMLVGVRILRNGTPLGVRQVKCESRLRELDQILRAYDNPLEFMCQTFGFHPGDKDQLDNWMVHAFQKNIPPYFNLLSTPPGDLQLSKNHSSSEENPTLLHFAARFGLEKLAWQLLECPGGDIACDMRNVNDLTPADLAEQAGHLKLAHQLRGYMQMNEFSNMYSYLKVMSENTTGSANGYRLLAHEVSERQREPPTAEEDVANRHQEDYCLPRPLSEAYSVPPVARPVMATVHTFPDYSTPPPLPLPNPTVASSTASEASDSATPTPMPLGAFASTSTLNASSMDLPLHGYLQINHEGLRSPDSTPTALASSQSLNQSPEASPADLKNPDPERSDQLSTKSSQSGRSSKTRESEPQDELLEIITDFKNNVFTISEVERLVENWRNRNDVQQSFKDKQRQLSAMRDEYERIQKRMKDEMKAPTPFDRIKKFFTKGKKDAKDSGGTNDDTAQNKQNNVNANLADRRPVSSLSLHSVSSSSSSGRMSTVSGCSGASLGDSGTHSDTDDRRHVIPEEKSVGITSYEIPPAPKPFNGRLYQPQSAGRVLPSTSGRPSASNNELDLRPVKSSQSTVDDKDYYIAFPPSGLPIHTFKPNTSSSAKEVKTPMTPTDFPGAGANTEQSLTVANSSKVYLNNNYANVLPIMTPPPGMCIPFQHMNITREPLNSTSNNKPTNENGNVLTIQPEIHPEPSRAKKFVETPDEKDDELSNENDANKMPKTESPKVPNTNHEAAVTDNRPDYVNVQVAASEDIARNFGVTLKKLPVPPAHQRCEFNFYAPANVGANDKTAED